MAARMISQIVLVLQKKIQMINTNQLSNRDLHYTLVLIDPHQPKKFQLPKCNFITFESSTDSDVMMQQLLFRKRWTERKFFFQCDAANSRVGVTFSSQLFNWGKKIQFLSRDAWKQNLAEGLWSSKNLKSLFLDLDQTCLGTTFKLIPLQ